jgi:multiple sugar transport system ATP-binding protein
VEIEVEVDVDVTEWLGSELFAYVPYEAEAEVRSRLQELDRDLDGEALRSQLVVSLDPKSRIRDGDRARLWFGPDTMHVFDPDSGRSLTHDDAAAERINREDDALRHVRRR